MPVEHDTIVGFQQEADKFNSIISLPDFETTTNAIELSVKTTIAGANAALDQIGRLQPADANFNNTLRALDDVNYGISLTENRLEIIKETSTDAALRDAATDQIKVIEEWAVGLDYREDVYRAVKVYADTKPQLTGEDAKLLKETMRDYTRAGLDLPKAQRDEVEGLRKKLSGLTTDFETHVTKAEHKMTFSKAELEGVPDDFLSQKGVKNDDGTYSIMANITWHYLTVMENAKNERTRLRLQTARDNLARRKTFPCSSKSSSCAIRWPTNSATRPGRITSSKSRWPRPPRGRRTFWRN